MKTIAQLITLFVVFISTTNIADAQLLITNQSNAQALVQKLVGQGVSVSNVTVTGSPLATGFFNNISGTNIGLDSGIVLSNGRVKTEGAIWGMDGNGIVPAYTFPISGNDSSATGAFANSSFGLPGDNNLSAILNGAATHDATILEFDFIPLGDTIKFRYVFGSEEYPTYPCAGVNDAFAFFINGPGFPGLTNIALIPGTTAPVTIDNINYNPGCGLYPQYYIPNRTNVNFTYNGHTTIFTALARVQPCQQYHLKLVIADVFDDAYDSGVFLEAKSLSSNAVQISNNTQLDQQNNSYLVEGCSTGSFKIKRPQADPSPLIVNLNYSGTATNGVDMQTLPAQVVIPANQTEVTVNVIPIVDNIPEGIETIKIYALGGCASGQPSDSTVIQIRDYDTLGIAPDTAIICKNNSMQLTATAGYTIYQWDTNPTLSNLTIRNPIASPVNTSTTYYCTATEGTCHGRDSSFIELKLLQLVSKTDVNCKGGSTGEIIVDGGPAWSAPVSYSINNGPYQAGNIFSNLPIGVYTIKIKDAGICIDSLVVNIIQAYPDLIITNLATTQASCSGNPDGTITITPGGGKLPYGYSLDGINFQAGNQFSVAGGNYTVTVKDINGCITTQNVTVPLDNIVTLDAGADIEICESKSKQFNTVSNAGSFVWTPSLYLNDNTLQNPTVSMPLATIKYYVTATTGICSRIDSVTMIFNPAPIPDAGNNEAICFGKSVQLSGSGGILFRWFPNTFLNNANLQHPTSIRPANSITYYLNVADAKGCLSLQKDSVHITVTPEAIVFAGRDTVVAIGQPLSLLAIDVNHSGFTNYLWSPSYGLNNPFIANPVALPDHDITYTVTAGTANGCEASSKIKITVYRGPEIYVANVFTPNGDQRNDVLRAKPVGIRSFTYFRIFNRWGQPVFTTTDAARGWDGRVNGVIQSTGTYAWMAEAVDYRGNVIQRKGTTTIIQ